MRKSFLTALLFVVSCGLFAQERDTIVVNRPDTIMVRPGVITRDTAFIITDTSVVARQTQPRRTDTTRTTRILRQFTLSHDFSEEVNMPADTVFTMFQRYRRADKYSPLNVTLGNYGLPFYQINFFDRISDPENFLYTYYYPFMYVPENAVFMNTQVPFTELNWTFAGVRRNSEQTFRVKHSQNVSRFLNFGLIYDIIFSLGQYNNQRSDDKNFTLFSSYTGSKYKMYFSGGINNINSFENGGIIDAGDLVDATNLRDVPVNLGSASNAVSRLKNRSLLLVQRYTLGGTSSNGNSEGSGKGFLGLSGTFSHILAMENNKKTYEDNFPASGFYDSVYIGTPTFDSLYSSYIRNTVRFDFSIGENRKFRLGGGAGIKNEAYRFSQIVPTFDTLFADTTGRRRVSNAIVGRLYNNIGNRFRWVATGDLYFSGYKTGDFNLNGIITKSFAFNKGLADWNVTGGISNRQPSYWFQNWGSNHFAWRENLSKEFRINVGTSFVFPARNTNIRFNYAIIDNYTDFDTTAMPSQHTGGLSVATLGINKELRAWKFHLASDILIQKSSNSGVLDLPLVALRSAGYFEHLFKFPTTGGELNTQIGVEASYHTSYHPYAYMPATGRFYRQDNYTAGNYPFINAFVNLKLKRTRIFVMYDHLNARRMGYDFFMSPYYPMNISMIRYGFAWTFYD